MVWASFTVLSIIALAVGTTGNTAEPVVEETREDGKSVIRITSENGMETVYRIDLSEQHLPASEQTDLLKLWNSYRLTNWP
jgi:hypothetical protein